MLAEGDPVIHIMDRLDAHKDDVAGKMLREDNQYIIGGMTCIVCKDGRYYAVAAV
ncbi:MAG: hypothetical protein QF535_21635 [Anaerolineales bacterium]|jgi:translation elongation factor P/translation initiation factor 5A|nr:hypothetical protein [Anaerolineales bacterium]